MAPLLATVYELERLRCNACGEVFTAQAPDGIGSEKYDEACLSKGKLEESCLEPPPDGELAASES